MPASSQIPKEAIDSLPASSDSQQWSVVLSKYPVDAWLGTLMDDTLSIDARKSLVRGCEGQTAYLPLVIRLLDQTSLGEAIARQIVAEPNWDRLQEKIIGAGLKNASDKEQLATSLSKLVVNKDLIFLFLGILFSRASLGAIAGIFVDGDKAVRLEAARILGTFDISATEHALVAALDDTDEKVRDEVLRALRQKLPEERLVAVIQSSREKAESMQSATKSARDMIFSLPSTIPGMGKVFTAMNAAFSVAAAAAGGLVSTASQTANSIGTAATSAAGALSTRWASLFNEGSISSEDPDALFALLLGLSWAEGVLSKDEQEALEGLVGEGGVPSELWQYAHKPPTLLALKPYLHKLKAPEKAVRGFAQFVENHSPTAHSQAWLSELAMILGLQTLSLSDMK